MSSYIALSDIKIDCSDVLSLSYYTKDISAKIFQFANHCMGPIFCNTLFMPLYGARTLSNRTLDACEKAKKVSGFSSEECTVDVSLEKKTYRLTYIAFKSKAPTNEFHVAVRIGGNDETNKTAMVRVCPLLKKFVKLTKTSTGLYFIQFCLYDQKVRDNSNGFIKWKPQSAKEISRVFFAFLEALNENMHIRPDTLLCHSLGSVALEALDEIPTKFVPKTIILDRALTSVWKVGRNIYGPIKARALYALAYFSSWSADPETQIIQFAERNAFSFSNDFRSRKIIIIETESDFYFSGSGALDEKFDTKLNTLGIQTYRFNFVINEIRFHARAHHALDLGLGKLQNKREKTTCMSRARSAAAWIAIHVFQKIT